MADIDDVLERLVTDPAFKAQLARDPATALAGYNLTDGDLALLSSQAGSHAGLGAVEQRTAKSGLFGLLSGAVDTAQGPRPGVPIAVTQGDSATSHPDGGATNASGQYVVTGVTHAADDPHVSAEASTAEGALVELLRVRGREHYLTAGTDAGSVSAEPS